MNDLYSIKMRSSKENIHISGAENIVNQESLDKAVSLLVKRALAHSKGSADFINLKIEKLEEDKVKYIEPLEVTTINVTNAKDGFLAVKKILNNINISNDKADIIVDTLNSIKDMRGAILLDINSMRRLEKCKERGVRVTYMDLENRSISGITKENGYNTHFIEALVLATKVISFPSIIAEICYSDDPDYTAGYIATKEFSYVRFEHLKEKGSSAGGRIFLYDGDISSVDECIEYLEKQRVIVKDNIRINKSVDFEKFMESGFDEEYRK